MSTAVFSIGYHERSCYIVINKHHHVTRRRWITAMMCDVTSFFFQKLVLHISKTNSVSVSCTTLAFMPLNRLNYRVITFGFLFGVWRREVVKKFANVSDWRERMRDDFYRYTDSQYKRRKPCFIWTAAKTQNFIFVTLYVVH